MKKIKAEHLAGVVLTILVLFPMLVKGIMCNDELLRRLWAQEGMDVYFKTNIMNEGILKGRAFGWIGSMSFLPYLSDNKYIFGAVNAIALLSVIVLFGYFTYKVWKNKRFSVLLCVLILVFLPMNFELALPNAYVIIVLQPMFFLLLSLIFYLNYLEDKKRKDIVICIILFVFAMTKYEFIITYVLLFPMIYIIKNYKKKSLTLKNIMQYNFPIAVSAVVYLLLYIGQRMVFPSNYGGNQLAVTSMSSFFHVLKILFFSAFPTYYSYFNAKYRFLFEYYNHGGVRLENIINPIIIVFTVMLVFLQGILLKPNEIEQGKKKTEKTTVWGKELLIIGTILLYAVLPALPNALTPLYQNGVSVDNFTSLPVSTYLYFAVMLVITYLIWNILKAIHKNWLTVSIVALITIGAVGNQIRNQVFVKEQEKNYESLVAMENVLALDYWKQFGSISISAPSLYETKNSLAIEEGHWSRYAAIYGNELTLDNKYDITNAANLVKQEDNSFYLYFDNIEILITQQTKSGNLALKDVVGQYKAVNVSDFIYSEGKYNFYLLKSDIK